MCSKYILFSPIGYNDPVGSQLDKSKIINSLETDKSKMPLEEYYKLKDSISKMDIIYSEGSMLSIVRKYKPYKVLLFLTDEMSKRSDKKGNSISDILIKKIQKIAPNCLEVSIKNSKYLANNLDYSLEDEEGKNFKEMIDELKIGFENSTLLVNITPSTAQIKSKLVLESIDMDNTNAVYLHYDRSNDLLSSNSSIYTDNIDFADFICDEYENYICNYKDAHEMPSLSIFRKNKIRYQIEALIKESYEYKAAYELFKNDNFINDNFSCILNLLNYADLRYNLKYSDKELYDAGIDLSDDVRIFQDNLNNLEHTNFKSLMEYFYVMKLKQKKGDLSDFILRLTPFLEFIDNKKNNLLDKNSCTYNDIKNKKEELELIKKKLRNTVAHQMVNVSEDDIQKESGIFSEDIINKCGELLELICGKFFNKEYFVYDEINKKILEKL